MTHSAELTPEKLVELLRESDLAPGNETDVVDALMPILTEMPRRAREAYMSYVANLPATEKPVSFLCFLDSLGETLSARMNLFCEKLRREAAHREGRRFNKPAPRDPADATKRSC